MRDVVLELLSKNYTPREVAAIAEMSVSDVTDIMKSEQVDGWGAPDHFTHIVSRRLPNAFEWPRAHAAHLADTKIAHDAGLVSMVQVKDSGFVVQYAFPNPEPIQRRPWFTAKPEPY
ncbi:hypothetical protein [Cupriavidus sp. RAF12]|uniref:hypothetical protein n=1 Tax=Cupriavidus sp. RAF12 TaxID=3233050 RepID=UPI003F90E120